ncbi:ATPase component of various ABC-type transport systems with duplicated ATPase domain [Sanguibacter keddieii DSM 10542]|uniref:ATPase component of various ABC-type transport systems with duplicated ATPase domain n=1 Tax=Sanguibacter keddieii (strain ATCC 51767 / DSM 10542 / NCFB 3025 / ST-74) TaxID=446469 RepID=D1BGK8_SANKS|nr:ABC transporter ATP-binding protein [Sanguibacter keddieii]ACZ21585.1 ATPase component of various ABC-type transport systems with duplicated ATPase domain [Sanguibacter keddieii DSM 10542]
MSTPVLTVTDLSVSIGRREIVHGLGFAVEPGGTLGIVGESGSGKSLSVLAATGLLDAPGARVTGSSVLRGAGDKDGVQLVGASPKALRKVHGNSIGFVFQDPSTSLHPLLTLERQITETLETHRGLSRRQARTRALELLEAVGLPDPERRLDSYPHQLSGGQRQRVMIAIALACDPALLVADEPTTALDVTTQAQIISLVQQLQHDRGTAVVWISHDLGVVGQVADDVLVLRDGEAVEHRPVLDLLDSPQHPYTQKLLEARPRLGKVAPPAPEGEVLLSVRDLDVKFPVQTPVGKTVVHAVDGVSFDVQRGRTLGIVGESGSGKSTIANALTGLVAPESGTATLGGTDLFRADRGLRRRLAMVFQDPFSSLDPRMRVGDSIDEPLRVHGLPSSGTRAERIEELLGLVDLPADFATRYPHELSGGQRQRISIARALALEPDVVILDEATASLDVSIQARVLELLRRLQVELGLTYVFIAHDLAIVQEMSHDVLVMQNGRAVEHAPAGRLFAEPAEEYTRALLAAVPPERPGR